ncbi:peptidase T [Microbacter margulisiae]|uniref:Peptidase T n=1 Tax=Microbacter margulisiae TaxID=1350067 RepID=A0A7W5H1S8_9PORP|nr:peptidase T [Microbacter margulisiae]MBB3187923.1 tripeptide aminopeptidase [Microbacter margulisiae]
MNTELVDRFLHYVSFETTSDENSGVTPSTPTQMMFAKVLAEEMKQLGLIDISISEYGYVMGTVPSNVAQTIPTIGFIAHMDTSPDMTGKNAYPRVEKNYNGGDIILNKEANIILSPRDFPELLQYKGHDIVVTDGNTLLGADDKAGIAEIMTAMSYLIQHPEIKHGTIRVAFNPDEEIGLGASKFDVANFNAEWAYTLDGGEIGELEFENFNAAGATITFKGRNVHPGYAKNKMINSLLIANQFVNMLPKQETPQHTENYEGFYHLTSMNGTVEKTTISYIIRDHDRAKFESRKKEMQQWVAKINMEYPNCATLTLRDQYFNMREQILPVMHVVDIVEESMREIGIAPKIKAIRGGTDGAQLSFKGLPCPNIFTGGHNFHGRYEYIPVQSMEKATELVLKIVQKITQKYAQ